MASAVANCSDGPCAVARFPPARAMAPHRNVEAINRAACLISGARRDSFGLHRTGPCDSNFLVQQPPRHQFWLRRLCLAPVWVSWFRPGTGGGGSRAAGWTGRRRDPHGASKGTTTRGTGSALRTCSGRQAVDDAMRAVIRNLIAPFSLILQGRAVALVAPSRLRPKPWSAFGIGDAAVGQNNSIPHGFDLLSAITFTHIFELNRWSHRCCI